MAGDFENFKEQVRDAADIVEVISGYVTLNKRGQNFWGCCPFHGEKTPSFSVNPGRNMFYCFGCHEGGDIFKFIMKMENCGFVDALKLLAGRYGIPIPEREKSPAEMQRERERNRIYETNDTAARFYHACLMNQKYGHEAMAYLQNRGITPEIIDNFNIGYALNSFDALLNTLGKRNFKPQELLSAGLVAEGGRRGHYDKFRHRVMIPIRDARGHIVGFGGRVLDGSTPKYLNTAETQWFNKRRILFGFDVAGREIRVSKQAIVVEGYMDAISLHAAGITNVVASMGTAFAEEQAKLLKRNCEEVVFCYDSDAAGRRASVRAVSIARNAGLRVRVAGVPDGKDPDEYVRAHGRDAFLEVIKNALEGIEFQINDTLLQNNIDNLAGKVQAVSNILPFLKECSTEIEVAEHIRRLAQRLMLDEGLIWDDYRSKTRTRTQNEAAPIQKAENEAMGVGQTTEDLLLAVLLENPDLLVETDNVIRQIGFTKSGYQQIYDKIKSSHHFDLQEQDGLDNEAQSILAGIMARQLPSGDAGQVLQDCLRKMQRNYLDKEYRKHSQLAIEYSQSGDARMMEELRESQRIQNEIKKLYG